MLDQHTSAKVDRQQAGDGGETRGRVLNAAAQLFAERGYARVTVRDICKKARANVAAVNYHFGGKDGLYRAVVETAIETMRGATDDARAAGEGQPPEEQLRTYVRVFITRMASMDHSVSWIHHLMMREMSDPTEALETVIDKGLRPRIAYLGSVVGQLMGCAPDDPRAIRCVMSLQAQFQMVMWSKALGDRAPDLTGPTVDAAQVAEHITRFALGGIAKTRGEP